MDIVGVKEVDIDATIVAKLEQIAIEEQIVILYACESGSRGWGFPSPDSDYDVRFVYLRPLEWYLSIDDRANTIDLPINSLLDINGWDLRKALKLFKGSNSAIYEWIQSPIVYQSNSNLAAELLDLADSYYCPRAGIHHYLSMANNCYLQHLQSADVKLKKYFYALRSILAARSIVQNRQVPPMVFGTLLESIADSRSVMPRARLRQRQDILTEIDSLLTIKATATEATTVPMSQVLNDFIEAEMGDCDRTVKLIPKNHTDSLDLNKLFQKYALGSNPSY